MVFFRAQRMKPSLAFLMGAGKRRSPGEPHLFIEIMYNRW